MIIRDSYGLIVGDLSGDGGDSLNREGIASYLFGVVSDGLKICLYEKEYPVRHPYNEPWNNYRNCSRDQLTPAICVGFKLKQKSISSRCLQTVLDHKGFAPNIERDKPGSTKHPYPHDFIDDKGELTRKSFDYADPITPDLWYLMLKGAGHNLKAALIYPLALLNVYATMFSYCYLNPQDDDVWQAVCVADCFGLLGYFEKHHPIGLRSLAGSYYSKKDAETGEVIGWRGTWKFTELWCEYIDQNT